MMNKLKNTKTTKTTIRDTMRKWNTNYTKRENYFDRVAKQMSTVIFRNFNHIFLYQ